MFVDCKDIFDKQITLDLISKYFTDIHNKKLVIIFSLPDCKPCQMLQHEIEEIFDNIKNDEIAMKNVSNIIKINALNISENDIKFLQKYPTVYTLNVNEIKIQKNEPILDYILKTKQIGYIGIPAYSFFLQNKLIIDF
jgi:thiol-disulfide isomerase/thioredoxin